MQISPVNNHKHQSFGVCASSYVQQVLSRGITTDSFDFPTFFKNTEKLANNLSKVGSKNTSLEKFRISRGFLDDFSKDILMLKEQYQKSFHYMNSLKERILVL